MYIIIAIIAFGVLIATHELGHFAAAKACGVRVLEFSIGMGPAIFKKQGKETAYCLRALPIGGFCSMEGEDEQSHDPRAFTNQGPLKRIIILVAGSAMNFLVGLLLILLLYSGAQGFSQPMITSFMDGCPYEGAGALEEGDLFYSINGERIYTTSDVSMYISRGGERADIVVIRDGRKVELEDFYITPVEYEIDGETVLKYGFYFENIETGLSAKLKYSWYAAKDFTRLIRISLVDLFTGAVGVKDLSGVVGIVDVISDVGKQSASFMIALENIMYLTAFIAINLAVVNLLPIPALDGGRVVLLILTWVIERITRRKIDPKYEGYLHTAGFALLMMLMVYVMYNDIARIIHG